jgi:hypothetical protein
MNPDACGVPPDAISIPVGDPKGPSSGTPGLFGAWWRVANVDLRAANLQSRRMHVLSNLLVEEYSDRAPSPVPSHHVIIEGMKR